LKIVAFWNFKLNLNVFNVVILNTFSYTLQSPYCKLSMFVNKFYNEIRIPIIRIPVRQIRITWRKMCDRVRLRL